MYSNLPAMTQGQSRTRRDSKVTLLKDNIALSLSTNSRSNCRRRTKLKHFRGKEQVYSLKDHSKLFHWWAALKHHYSRQADLLDNSKACSTRGLKVDKMSQDSLSKAYQKNVLNTHSSKKAAIILTKLTQMCANCFVISKMRQNRETQKPS